MSKTKTIVFISLFVALISVCAWIQIPTAIPFTLQTFAIFLTLLCLGGKKGTLTILCYLLLGMVGAPVFSGFRGGISVFVQPTGGYILGFVVMGLCYWTFERFNKPIVKILSLVLALALLYIFGTVWFVFIASKGNKVGFLSAFMTCVVPFIVPDLLKLFLAFALSLKLKKPLESAMKTSKSM